MGFVKKIWKNRVAEFMNRYTLETEDGAVRNVILKASDGIVSQEGDTFSAATMNDMENRIEQGFVSVDNKHNILRIHVDTTDWIEDTTSQDGSTLYKKTISLNHVYVDSPSVSITNDNTNVLPTVAQQEDYDNLQYATVDDTIPCLYLYSSAVPVTGFWLNVEGVD